MAKHGSKSMAQEDVTAVSATTPPIHPIPQLQGPFEESILESMNDRNDRQEKVDPITRRKQLLERERYERTCAGRWKQRAGEKFHPLWKLVAQISFGMHLLAHGLAKSNKEVMKILQTHVDEIDGFLERTTEDFELGQKDIQDRIRLLRVPLENVKIFDHMLEDRDFRLSIVDGNEKIEHIIGRTSRAMNDALKDVQKGINATKGLEKYLAEMNMGWEEKSEETEAVYLAMMSNLEGWNIAFLDLQMKGNSLGVALVQLGGIVSEMSKRAGIASRRTLRSPLPPVTTSSRQHRSSTKAQRKSSNNTVRTRQSDKPLPEAPDPVDEAVQATLPRRHPDHKAVRRASRKTAENDRHDPVKRVSQLKNSRSVPELSQTRPLQHVSSLRARGRSPSIRRLLSKKQQPLQVHVTPKPSPPAKDTPKNLSQKPSFFGSNSTSPDEATNGPGRLQKRSSSFPPGSSYFPPGSSYFIPPAPPSVPDGVASEPDSEAATSTSAAPAPFVPTRRQPPRRMGSRNALIARALARNASNPIPTVVVDDTATTTNARSENDFLAVESSQDQHQDDTLTALPVAQPESNHKSLRKVLSLSRNAKPPKRTSSLRTSKPKLNLFPVKSSEHLILNHSVTSPTNFTPHYPPRPSSTPPFTDKATARTEPHQKQSPLPSFPRPLTPTDSQKSSPKTTSKLGASPPDSPNSITASLPPLPLPPHSIKRYQAKSAIADYTSTSTELLDLLAASPPASSPPYKRTEHPNPLRSHAPVQIPTNIPSSRSPMLDDEFRSSPPPGTGRPAMVMRDFVAQPQIPARKSTDGEKKGLKRIFSRRQGSKRETRTVSGGDGKWFSGMGKDGAWVKK